MGIWFDGLFLITLLVAMPVYEWHLRKTKDMRTSLIGPAKYRLTIISALFLLGLLFIAWQTNNRTFVDLGLGSPNKRGLVGIWAAGLLSLAFIALSFIPPKTPTDEWKEMNEEQNKIFPNSTSELVGFIFFAFIAGFAWEVLYRGALLYYFSPYFGVPFSVLIAAAIYTFIHRANSWKAYAATFVAALSFLVFFVLSESLWGPIILHIAAPVLGVWAHSRMKKQLSVQKNEG